MASKEEALIQSVFFTQMEYYCNASILGVFVIITRACTIGFDFFVVSILWTRGSQVWRASKATLQESNLMQLLLKDGTLLFVFLLILNSLDVVLWLSIGFNWITSLFILPIACALVARCLLNLREVTGPSQSSAGQDVTELSFVHSLGGSHETTQPMGNLDAGTTA
ncbi:uncharacterized protein C8Q71DRAFT_854512 [Rhodofomes roseus]|uniref:Uncharacterized protein n=1 Tax=Rhodofomes roseus TaxID=34475 RepID=A0ABQ8KPU4_9APHY|nr:uncharacterized protein C8Q71DRAFT_854512 [Rhodofomes roseus]KAH9840637.1 hypothetical protein C8Q71DRAFT_854512 [Rhodofomes roseus]